MFRVEFAKSVLAGLLAADSVPADYSADIVCAIAINYADVLEQMLMKEPIEIQDFLVKNVLKMDNVVMFGKSKKKPAPPEPTPPAAI